MPKKEKKEESVDAIALARMTASSRTPVATKQHYRPSRSLTGKGTEVSSAMTKLATLEWLGPGRVALRLQLKFYACSEGIVRFAYLEDR